jgi:hypothetical protein
VKPQQVMAGSIDPPNQLDRRKLGEDAQLFVPLTENSVVLPYRDRSSGITGGRAWRFHGDPAEIAGRNLLNRGIVAAMAANSRYRLTVNRRGFDAASFFEKDADYVEALPGRAA